MKTKFFLLVLTLALSQSAFSQNNPTENPPKAYLFGSTNGLVNRPKAYLFDSDKNDSALARPRIYKSEKINSVEKPKAVVSFDLERRAFELINGQRKIYGLPSLVWSDDVARIARLHSENMANFHFFSHTGLDGLMVNNRADLLGIRKWQAIGENIAYNQGFANPVEFAVERWMKSPEHRENLLSSRWKESGVGIAVTNDGTYYFTEVFLSRK